MTYCPCIGHRTVKTGGTVVTVKWLSLKHSLPSDISVVLDTYNEKPKKLDGRYGFKPGKQDNDVLHEPKIHMIIVRCFYLVYFFLFFLNMAAIIFEFRSKAYQTNKTWGF